jgi:beta-phosphoglucomutase-like phosphatase (HAD superfamily)
VAMVDAVVFDLDVGLVDSEPIWEGVRRRYVADTGGRWLPDSQQRLMGMSTSEWGGVSQRRARRGANVVADMVSRYQAGVPLIPGAASIVRTLAQHWPLGLASSSPPALIDGCCKYPLCKQMSAQSRTGR